MTAEALDTPFLLLPYRPETDTAHTKTFINNFFKANREGSRSHSGASLGTELVLTDIAVHSPAETHIYNVSANVSIGLV